MNIPFDLKISELTELFEYSFVQFNADDVSTTFKSNADSGLAIRITVSAINTIIGVQMTCNGDQISSLSIEGVRYIEIKEAERQIRFDVGTDNLHGYVLVGLAPKIFVTSVVFEGRNPNTPIAS